MNPLAAITAFLNAATAALKAFPVWLAWHITKDCEQISKDIILNENRNTPTGRRDADELRISLAYRRRLHDALCPADAAPKSGDGSPDSTRAVPVPD